MKEYSPYENIQKREYPDVLLMGSLNDTRVGYFEPTKLIAKLRFKCQVSFSFISN
jgi:protease II